MTSTPLLIRDLLARMIQNAEALLRLSIATETKPLDPDRVAHLHELLDDIGTRDARITEALNDQYVRRHLDRRVLPYERRTASGDRRQV